MIWPRSTAREWRGRDVIPVHATSTALISLYICWRQGKKKTKTQTLTPSQPTQPRAAAPRLVSRSRRWSETGDSSLAEGLRFDLESRVLNSWPGEGGRVSRGRQVQGLNQLKSHSTHSREYPGASAKLAQWKVISVPAPLWELFKNKKTEKLIFHLSQE